MSIRVHRSTDEGDTSVDFPAANGWIVHANTEGMDVTQDEELVATFARHCWTWVEDRDMTNPQGGAA